MEVSSHALELHRAAGDRVRLRGVHEPDAGPPRLPRDAGRLLRGQAEAVPARRRRAADAPPSSTSTTNGADASPARSTRRARTRHVRGGAGCRLPRAAACATTRPARRSSARPQRARVEVRLPLPGLFNVYNALAAIAAARRARRAAGRGRGGARATPAACLAASSRSRRARASACWWTTRTRRTRSRTCSVSARELLEQAGGEGRLIVRVRRGRRPRPGEAPADGRGGAAPRRPHARDLGQPALGGPGRDHRRDRRRRRGRRSGGRGLRRGGRGAIAAPRSSARWRWRGPATSS